MNLSAEVSKVRADATALWAIHEAKDDSEFNEFADCVVFSCKENDHPKLADGMCLCSMLCDNRKEVIMAAYFFTSDDDDILDVDDEAAIVFLPTEAKNAMDDGDTLVETLATFDDLGAAKVLIKDLVAAYNTVHNTKFEV